MTRLTVHTADSAPGDSKELVAKAIANNGFLPNLIGVLAGAPTALETYMTVGGINARTSLDLTQREVVQITAARLHGCDFCIAGHSAVALKKAGWPPAAVVALQSGQPTGDPKIDSIAAFTAAVIGARGNVADADLKNFLAAGHNEQQALEVVLGVSLATLCNFANTLAQSPINPQLLPFSAGVLKA